ncbi:MAG: hypothetical protein JXB15_07830 [Anaerolineales bacterium]|nr:hypothetical protein [Anaerolineales bacterium]
MTKTAPRTHIHRPICRGLFAALLMALGLWLSQVSTPGRSPEGCLQGCGREEISSKAGSLRVLSFNMLHGFPDFTDLKLRLELIGQEIERLQADVVLLQETPWTLQTGMAAEALAQRLGMNYAYQRANGGRYSILFEEGEAILSRYPLTVLEWVELKPAAGWFENRVALAAQTQTPYGPLWLVSTHLTTQDGEVEAGQSEALISFVASLEGSLVLVGGDFNRDPAVLAQEATPPWDDPLGRLQPGPDRLTCCIDDRQAAAEDVEKAIDAILIAGGLPALEAAGWRVATANRVFNQPILTIQGWLWLSDHIGVLLELERIP